MIPVPFELGILALSAREGELRQGSNYLFITNHLRNILIVLGLVGVMYCPLSYILRMQDPDIAMLQKWFEGLGWTLQDNSYQLTMIHEIQNGISGVPENLMGLIEKISDFDMNFIGFNLSEKPLT